MVKHQHGGKLIDSGTYGCINYPALPCWSKQKQTSRQYHDKTFVSKIMTTDEAEYEIKNIKEIKKLDYLDVFTLRNIQICKANEFSEKTDNLSKCNVIYHDDVIDKSCKGKKLFYPKKCNYTHSLNPNYTLILMPKLKETLFDIMLKVIDSKNPSKKIINDGLDIGLNLFYACAFLSSQLFIHFDIKENNIGHDGEKPVLFDFGLSYKFMIGKKATYKASQRISQSYDYYMYQITSGCLLDKLSLEMDEVNDSLFTPHGKKGKDNYANILKWLETAPDTNQYINLKNIAKLFNFTKDEYVQKTAKTLVIIYGYCLPTFNNDDKKWLAKKVLETVDSYALGISLLFYIHIIKKYISAELKKDLLDIIKNACHYNILARAWPSQVVDLVDELIKKHNLNSKYLDLRPYKLSSIPDTPKSIIEVLEVLNKKL